MPPVSLKRDLICPQCEGRLVLNVERLQVLDRAQHAPAMVTVKIKKSWFMPTAEGFFEAFICKCCGFTELYAHGIAGIEADPDRGVNVIDNRPKTQEEGPLR